MTEDTRLIEAYLRLSSVLPQHMPLAEVVVSQAGEIGIRFREYSGPLPWKWPSLVLDTLNSRLPEERKLYLLAHCDSIYTRTVVDYERWLI